MGPCWLAETEALRAPLLSLLADVSDRSRHGVKRGAEHGAQRLRIRRETAGATRKGLSGHTESGQKGSFQVSTDQRDGVERWTKRGAKRLRIGCEMWRDTRVNPGANSRELGGWVRDRAQQTAANSGSGVNPV
jgi:hypothetical protein